MNILIFIFSFLMLFAITFSMQLENHVISRVLEKTCEKHMTAIRKMNEKIESRTFISLPGVYLDQKPRERNEVKEHRDPAPKINPACSRLNLWPLIQEGKDVQIERYQIASRLLRAFYPDVFSRPHSETEFLDLFLFFAKQKEKAPFPLETLSFQDKDFQYLYYRLLRSSVPFLDFFKLEEGSSRICLFHANTAMLEGLFNRAAAEEIYRALHQKKPPLNQDGLVAICSRCKSTLIPPKFLHVRRARHAKSHEMSLIEDSLRKKVYLEQGL